MSHKLVFTVPGEPVGKGRPRAHARVVRGMDGPEAIVTLHTPRETRQAEARVRKIFQTKFPHHRRWTGAVMLRFTAVFETPQSFNRALKEAAARGLLYATKKPDKDNIEKLIVDALNGVAWADDVQVMGGGVKRYGSPGRIDVVLELIDQPGVPLTPGEQRAIKKAQQELPLAPPDKRKSIPSKTQSVAPAKPPPDLSMYNTKQRALIEAALAREAQERGRR